MSPERVRRAGHSKADDMWAMGVCLFIMLCGSHPFDPNGSRSAISIADEIERGHYDTENPLWSALSSSARDLISRLLERDKSKRITNVRGVQSARISLLSFTFSLVPHHFYHSRSHSCHITLSCQHSLISLKCNEILNSRFVLERRCMNF